MDLNKTFNTLLAEMATSLQAQGYQRQGLAFTRDRGSYIEHYVFQADRYNVKDIHCRYFLNIGLEFPSLSPAGRWAYRRQPRTVSWLGNKSLPLNYVCPTAVWGTRSNLLVPTQPDSFEVKPDSDLAAIKQSILESIRLCGDELPAWANSLRGNVLQARILGWLAWPFIRHQLKQP